MFLNNLSLKPAQKQVIIWLIIIFSAFVNAFGVKIFMKPLHAIPVGISGLAVLIEQVFEKFLNFKFEYYYIYLVMNVVLALWGWFFVSKSLVKKSALYIISFTIISRLLPEFSVSHDYFINIVSGAICNSMSNVILLYVGSSAAGFNFIGLFLSKKLQKGVVGKTNFTINSTVISIAGLLFGLERAIISFITVMINSAIIDRFHNQANYVTLFIVTKKPNLFTEYATEHLKRTATILDSVGSYSQEKNYTILLTISKFRFGHLKKEISHIDKDAYITILSANQVIGNMKSKVGLSAI